mgnify:CR=1 FL=1
MNKLNKIFFLIIFFTVSACGFTPIMSKKNFDFSVKIIETTGNEKINSHISQRLNYLSDTKKSETFFLTIETDLEKTVVSKDSKGDPSIFELYLIAEISIKDKNEKEYKKKIDKKNTYNNKTDKFELEQYEEILIKNGSENIAEEILSYLLTL